MINVVHVIPLKILIDVWIFIHDMLILATFAIIEMPCNNNYLVIIILKKSSLQDISTIHDWSKYYLILIKRHRYIINPIDNCVIY